MLSPRRLISPMVNDISPLPGFVLDRLVELITSSSKCMVDSERIELS